MTLMRTDPAGHFNFAYRFRKTFQTTTYEFRAAVPRERGYPFRRGWSRIRRAAVESVDDLTDALLLEPLSHRRGWVAVELRSRREGQ